MLLRIQRGHQIQNTEQTGSTENTGIISVNLFEQNNAHTCLIHQIQLLVSDLFNAENYYPSSAEVVINEFVETT